MEALIFDAEGPFMAARNTKRQSGFKMPYPQKLLGGGENIFCLDQFTHQKSEVLLGDGGVVAYYFLHPKSGKEYNSTNLD